MEKQNKKIISKLWIFKTTAISKHNKYEGKIRYLTETKLEMEKSSFGVCLKVIFRVFLEALHFLII